MQKQETIMVPKKQKKEEPITEKKERQPLENYAVVKRNGMLVPFNKERIAAALELAFRDTKNIPEKAPLPEEISQTIKTVVSLIIEEIYQLVSVGTSLTVEGIQDIVEVKLMQAGHLEVARDYIIYRNKHKTLREDSPSHLKILRRDGISFVRFNPIKIAAAIEKAFRDTLKITGPTPSQVVETVNALTQKIVAFCLQKSKKNKVLSIEGIQNEIEDLLMAEGHHAVAKDFILYRNTRATKRVKKEILPEETPVKSKDTFTVTAADGTQYSLSKQHIQEKMAFACRGYEDLVSVTSLTQQSIENFYDGISSKEVDLSNILAARTKIETEQAYTYVAANLLLDVVYREVLGIEAYHPQKKEKHHAYFKQYLKNAVSLGYLDPQLLHFDLDALAAALDLERDSQFTYLGLQTLYDRYFLHHKQKRLETPQIFWMRIAMGLSSKEGKEKEKRAIEFYHVLSKFLYVSSTPTLFNAGTCHSQLSSCYLSTVMDNLSHIYKVIADDAQLSKWAGGIGNDWTNVRATGALIKGTNGHSQGIIPFLKVANDTAVAVNQGGKRKGAMCAYLETWHLDIEDFLELRKNTGDERRRTHDMNTANWIPDLFMKRVLAKQSWTLFSPDEVKDLHDLYGPAFEKRYVEYEKMAEEGTIKLFKKVDAVSLWRKMLGMLYETGHPWITFKDPSNICSPQDHVGTIHSSNLCTEILLNTSAEETAVCNLGSINLAAHTSEKGIDHKRLQETIHTAIRMLDNVIDINFYPTKEAAQANYRHRPIGLGLMGFQDALYKLNISYASHEAIEYADQSMELISYYAILSSSELAKERGSYPSYKGSKWDRGLLPCDGMALLAEKRGKEFVSSNTNASLDWTPVRESIRKYGMRNSNTMAIAPTATIANIIGVTPSIEPTYKHLFVKSNLSGEFTTLNIYLMEKLKALNLWDEEMLDDLKYFDGSIEEISRIPKAIKKLFPTAFELDPIWLIECAARRQKWIDMGQSLNLYLAEPSGKKLDEMYFTCWKKGLKTTYYLRTVGATQIEKSTTDINKRSIQPRWMKSKSASSRIVVQREKKPTVCNLEENCESCQ